MLHSSDRGSFIYCSGVDCNHRSPIIPPHINIENLYEFLRGVNWTMRLDPYARICSRFSDAIYNDHYCPSCIEKEKYGKDITFSDREKTSNLYKKLMEYMNR